MEEKLKNSTSINIQEPSEQDTTTNHSISRAQEDLPICKSGAPTADGGNCSN